VNAVMNLRVLAPRSQLVTLYLMEELRDAYFSVGKREDTRPIK
jgi:hypothetical protein